MRGTFFLLFLGRGTAVRPEQQTAELELRSAVVGAWAPVLFDWFQAKNRLMFVPEPNVDAMSALVDLRTRYMNEVLLRLPDGTTQSIFDARLSAEAGHTDAFLANHLQRNGCNGQRGCLGVTQGEGVE